MKNNTETQVPFRHKHPHQSRKKLQIHGVERNQTLSPNTSTSTEGAKGLRNLLHIPKVPLLLEPHEQHGNWSTEFFQCCPPYSKGTPDQKDHAYDNIRNGKTKGIEKRYQWRGQQELLGVRGSSTEIFFWLLLAINWKISSVAAGLENRALLNHNFTAVTDTNDYSQIDQHSCGKNQEVKFSTFTWQVSSSHQGSDWWVSKFWSRFTVKHMYTAKY